MRKTLVFICNIWGQTSVQHDTTPLQKLKNIRPPSTTEKFGAQQGPIPLSNLESNWLNQHKPSGRCTSMFQRFREYSEDLDMSIYIVPYSQHLKQLKLYRLQRQQECYVIIYICIKLNLTSSPTMVCKGVQSPTWKNTATPKEPIPTWSDIT